MVIGLINISIKKIVGPFDINQVIFKNMYYRSHVISFLFKCYLSSSEELKLLELAKSDKNSRFFKKIPYIIIAYDIYPQILDKMGWKEGDSLDLSLTENGGICLKKE